jgi:hypothetical protein
VFPCFSGWKLGFWPSEEGHERGSVVKFWVERGPSRSLACRPLMARTLTSRSAAHLRFRTDVAHRDGQEKFEFALAESSGSPIRRGLSFIAMSRSFSKNGAVTNDPPNVTGARPL